MWRYLAASVGPVDAWDCYQETFLAALRAYPELRPDSKVRAWLFTIAHHKAIDAHRSRARRPLPVESLPERPTSPPGARAEGGPLWALVRRLPPKQRQAVAARYVADLGYADIGRMLGCSEEAARQNVRAALRRLREGLADS